MEGLLYSNTMIRGAAGGMTSPEGTLLRSEGQTATWTTEDY